MRVLFCVLIACSAFGQTRMPIVFEEYRSGAMYQTRGAAVPIRVFRDGIACGDTQLTFAGIDPASTLVGDGTAGISSYFNGRSVEQWRGGIATHSALTFAGAYPGVEILLHSRRGHLEFDFYVARGADPGLILLRVSGARAVTVNEDGDLVVTALCRFTLRAPKAFQRFGNAQREVPVHYRVNGNTVGFVVGEYDSERELLIDPVLDFSTFVGGVGSDSVSSIVTDAAGNIYVAGTSQTPNQPTLHPLQQTSGSSYDAFVMKLSPDASRVVYYVHLGGEGADGAEAIAVDSTGAVVIAGVTDSTDFPGVNAVQPQLKSAYQTAFAAKVHPNGRSLLFATYLGGSLLDQATSVALDREGSVYLAGFTQSADFPRTVGPLHAGHSDAFVVKLHATGSPVLFSRLLGGARLDGAAKVRVNSRNQAVVVGSTQSDDFPLARPLHAQRARLDESGAGFITKLSPEGALLVSTYFGGGGTNVRGVAIGGDDDLFVVGHAFAETVPITNALQATLKGPVDLVVARLDSEVSTYRYATYIGCHVADQRLVIEVDGQGAAYIGATSGSDSFPVVQSVQSRLAGSDDGVALKLSADGRSLLFATYLGGQRRDTIWAMALSAAGQLILGGYSESDDFPIARPIVGSNRGNRDGYVAIIGGVGQLGGGELVSATPSALSFTSRLPGVPEPQQIRLSSTSATSFIASISGGSWLRVSPSNGPLPGTVAVSVDPRDLGAGVYSARISFGATVVPVELRVTDAGVSIAVLRPTELEVDAQNPVVTVEGTGFLPNAVIRIDGTPLTTRAVNERTLSATVQATVVAREGRYSVTVANPDGAVSNALPLTVTPPRPQITAAAIVNAASYGGGAVSPGELVTIFGTRLGPQDPLGPQLNATGSVTTELGGTRVLFDGLPAPLLYVSRAQITTVVPYGVAGQSTSSVQVESQGRTSNPVTIPLALTTPALFSANASGKGQAAALNEDGGVNSRDLPAGRGSVVVLFGTGFGITSPSPVDGGIATGLARPILPVAVLIGGAQAEVLYAGAAPGQVHGVMQVNARVPASVAAGAAVPVVIEVGGVRSPDGVTIAVR